MNDLLLSATHFLDDAIDRHVRNTQGTRCGCGAITRFKQIKNGAPIYARLSSGVDAGLLCASNTFGLTISADVGLELSEDGQHPEEGTTGRCRAIDALLQHAEMGASLFDLVGDVGEVSQRPAQSVKSRDD